MKNNNSDSNHATNNVTSDHNDNAIKNNEVKKSMATQGGGVAILKGENQMKQNNEKELLLNYFQYKGRKSRSQENIVLEVISLWNKENRMLKVQEIRDLGFSALSKAWTRSPMLSYRRVKEVIYTKSEYFSRLNIDLQNMVTDMLALAETKINQSKNDPAPNDELFNIFSYSNENNPNQSTTVRNLHDQDICGLPDVGTLMFDESIGCDSSPSEIDQAAFYDPDDFNVNSQETIVRGLPEDFFQGTDCKQSISESSKNKSFFPRLKINNDQNVKEPLRHEKPSDPDWCVEKDPSAILTRDITENSMISKEGQNNVSIPLLTRDNAKNPMISCQDFGQNLPKIKPNPDPKKSWMLPSIKEIKGRNTKPVAKVEKIKKGISIQNAHLRIDETGRTLIEWNNANQRIGFIVDKDQALMCVNGSILSKKPLEPSFEIKNFLEENLEQPGFENMDFQPIDAEEKARRDLRKSNRDKYEKWFKKNKYIEGLAKGTPLQNCKLEDASYPEVCVISAVAYEQWLIHLSRDRDIMEERYGLTKKFIKTVEYRLKDGFTPVEIVRATIACTLDDYHKEHNIDFLLAGIHSEKKLRQALQMRKKQKGEAVETVGGIQKIREEKAGVYRDPVTGRKISYQRYLARTSAIADLEEQREQRRMESIS